MPSILGAKFFQNPVSAFERLNIARILDAGTTVVVLGDCLVFSCKINNPTNQAVTVSITNNAAAPVNLLPPDLIPPGGWTGVTDHWGDFLESGMLVTASAPGLHLIGMCQQLP